jgi:hypothetical protein
MPALLRRAALAVAVRFSDTADVVCVKDHVEESVRRWEGHEVSADQHADLLKALAAAWAISAS